MYNLGILWKLLNQKKHQVSDYVMNGVGVVGIERSELREVAAMCVLQYPQRYSIRGYCSRGGGGG